MSVDEEWGRRSLEAAPRSAPPGNPGLMRRCERWPSSVRPEYLWARFQYQVKGRLRSASKAPEPAAGHNDFS